MKKVIINGIEFINFGSNNYSEGMECVACDYPPKDLVKQVRDRKIYGLWLNPSAPCSDSEFFGVFGTEEQYKKFYERQRGAQIAKRLVDKFGLDNCPDNYKEERAKIEREYKDWWDT